MLSQSELLLRFDNGASTGRASNLFAEGDVLFSYGHHFPLAVRRTWGAGIRFLINGDRYSVSTASHQRHCIDCLTPNVQVPFSALDAASLTRRGVPNIALRIVARERETWHTTCKFCGREVGYRSDPALGYPAGHYHADDQTPICTVSDKPALHHVLGGVVLEHDGVYFLSSIDEGESWRLRSYFLCQLPTTVTTVKEAFDVLMPNAVKIAKDEGCEIRRQGDIFLIATGHKTREIHALTQRRARLFDTTHVATEVRVNSGVFVRGTLRHKPEGRRPQHAMLRLGDSWWRAVKNTAVASWNAIGLVD